MDFLKAGLIAVTVNTRLKPSEIEFILSYSQARAASPNRCSRQSRNRLVPRVRFFTQLPALETATAQDATLPQVDQDQPALLIYASGTTARPTGVVHTHRSLFQMAILGSGLPGLRPLPKESASVFFL
jgi:long-chain acyl-CoA synthetase